MLKTGDVARKIGVSKNTVRRWVEEGYLPCMILPSGYRMFKEDDVEAFERDSLKHLDMGKGGTEGEV